MTNILRIQRQKEDDKIKEKERLERRAILMAETGMTFDDDNDEDEEDKADTKTKGKKKKKEVPEDPEEIERRKAAAAKAKDIATYGRTWIWEDYHEDKEELTQAWLAGAASIARIDGQVLEDVDDWIIIQGWKDSKLTNAQIDKLIESNLETQRNRLRMVQSEEEAKEVPEETTYYAQKPLDIMEEGKLEDGRRNFMNPLRPHEMIWKFHYDDEKSRPKHVLRPDANPVKCYIDGRIEKLLDNIAAVAMHLKSFNAERWEKLNMHTLEIFIALEKDDEKAYTKWAATQQQN